MHNDHETRKLAEPGTAERYVAPQLTLIGDAAHVILGVAGSGDDFMGYSFPEFEFVADDELPSGRGHVINPF